MQYFLSPYFYVAVAVAAGVLQATSRMSKISPRLVLALISCVFILAFFGLDPFAVLCVALALGVNFAAVCLFGADRLKAVPPLKRAVFLGTIFFDLALLGLAKYAVIQNVASLRELGQRLAISAQSAYPPRIIGISYLTFRLIHFVSDAYQRSYRKLRFTEFLNFMIFFPTFVSGPIDRFDRFRTDLDALHRFRLDADLCNHALYRITSGLCRKVAATLLMGYAIGAVPPTAYATAPATRILAGIYLFTGVLYLDLSGYTDLAIGVGRLFGIRSPENFNYPFRSLSIQEYWTRWHMTLSLWIKDYIYFPLAKYLYGTSLSVVSALIPVIAFSIAFTLCGLWHGDSLNFLVWGALNGLGLGLYALYRELMRRPRLRPFYRRLGSNRAWIGCSWVITMSFVAFTNLFVALDWEHAVAVCRRLYAIPFR